MDWLVGGVGLVPPKINKTLLKLSDYKEKKMKLKEWTKLISNQKLQRKHLKKKNFRCFIVQLGLGLLFSLP